MSRHRTREADGAGEAAPPRSQNVAAVAVSRVGNGTVAAVGLRAYRGRMTAATSYTGHVEPGGPPARRLLTDVEIVKVSVGEMDNNTYLLTCRHTGQRLLIDAAAEPDRLRAILGPGRLDTIVTTHRHADHWQALEVVSERTGAAVLAHVLDTAALPVPVDGALEDGDVVNLGVSTLAVVHLGGHTPGSIALVYDDPSGRAHLFTGDGLFPGGVGGTGGDQEAFHILFGNVRHRLFEAFPDDSWVYPGHGDDTTLGTERPHLDEWAARGW
jgi:glyoxylase-like metal-dependent hydrolase (beta-lactamase superfamily II)